MNDFTQIENVNKLAIWNVYKKDIIEKLLFKKNVSPVKREQKDSQFTLPPTPRVNDPELRELIKKFPMGPSIRGQEELNKEYLGKNKAKVTNLIRQWFEYENEDEIPFKYKYNYRLFIENYYQSKYEEMLDVVRQIENIDVR